MIDLKKWAKKTNIDLKFTMFITLLGTLIQVQGVMICNNDKIIQDKKTQHIDTINIKDTTYDTLTIHLKKTDGLLPDYEMCDDGFIIKGKLFSNTKRKYLYLVTDGCTKDSIGGIYGFRLFSNNEYKIGNKLTLREE